MPLVLPERKPALTHMLIPQPRPSGTFTAWGAPRGWATAATRCCACCPASVRTWSTCASTAWHSRQALGKHALARSCTLFLQTPAAGLAALLRLASAGLHRAAAAKQLVERCSPGGPTSEGKGIRVRFDAPAPAPPIALDCRSSRWRRCSAGSPPGRMPPRCVGRAGGRASWQIGWPAGWASGLW